MTSAIATAVFLVLLVLAAVWMARQRNGQGTGETRPGYRKHGYLLSKAELSFFHALKQAVGDKATVTCKVRVADVLTPQKGLERKIWQSAFNRISAKHFDFVLIAPRDASILAAIELDDASHGETAAKARDSFLSEAAESAGLPLVRIPAQSGYAIRELRQKLAAYLDIDIQAEQAIKTHPADLIEMDISHPIDPEAPRCPICDNLMFEKRLSSGKIRGQAFWTCIDYPRCKGIIPIAPKFEFEV